MGTRNLTMVISNNETKVAQYGQYDGYPSGQGATALNFLRNCNMKSFKEKVDKLHFFTPEELKSLERREKQGETFEYLNRGTGAQILNGIYIGEIKEGRTWIDVEIEGLINDEAFAGDSLFCEWAYVIDLDKQTFEVFQGFNKEPLTADERFYKYNESRENEYYPVKRIRRYSLLDLPTEDQFIAELETSEEA